MQRYWHSYHDGLHVLDRVHFLSYQRTLILRKIITSKGQTSNVLHEQAGHISEDSQVKSTIVVAVDQIGICYLLGMPLQPFNLWVQKAN